jgi:MFS-type transporter involved in bile tolerance (Atg22 family)
MMIAGGLGGWMVEHAPLWVILLLDATTYLASFLIQATLPYEATHLKNQNSTTVAARPSVWQSVAEGWQWLRERPQLTLFLTCSLLPFIVVMAGNYLFPIYVSQTLHVGALWFAAGEITFALGAIAAGALLPRLIAQHSAANTIPATMLVFLAGILLVLVVKVPLIYLAAGVLLGFGNAGCRVARSALMLNLIPNEVMGRVGGFYNVLDRVLRTLLVFALGVIEFGGPPMGFVVLLAVLVVALVGVMQSRTVLRSATPAALPA